MKTEKSNESYTEIGEQKAFPQSTCSVSKSDGYKAFIISLDRLMSFGEKAMELNPKDDYYHGYLEALIVVHSMLALVDYPNDNKEKIIELISQNERDKQ